MAHDGTRTKRWAAAMALLALAPLLAAHPSPEPPAEFRAFLAKVDAAQLELQNGRPEAFKALWAHTDEVTLSGGFGGTVEKGWAAIGPRLDWVGAQFSQGSNTIDRIVTSADGELGYVVQVEHIRFRVPGAGQDSSREYRVTMIFRRGPEGWRIIHRQADSQMQKQAPSAPSAPARGADAKSMAIQADYDALTGRWQLVKSVVDGRPVSEAEVKSTVLITDHDEFRFPADAGVGTAPLGRFTIDPATTPKQVDSTSFSGADAGQVSLGIYEILDADDKRACWAKPGKPRPTSFESTPGSGWTVQYWRLLRKDVGP